MACLTRSKRLRFKQKKDFRKLRHLFGSVEGRDWCGLKDLTPYSAAVGEIKLK